MTKFVEIIKFFRTYLMPKLKYDVWRINLFLKKKKIKLYSEIIVYYCILKENLHPMTIVIHSVIICFTENESNHYLYHSLQNRICNLYSPFVPLNRVLCNSTTNCYYSLIIFPLQREANSMIQISTQIYPTIYNWQHRSTFINCHNSWPNYYHARSINSLT